MGSKLPGREDILAAFLACFRDDLRVRAFWLEGSDGLGRADEYSDLDLWLDVDDEAMEEVMEAAVAVAESFGPLDADVFVPHPDGQILQRNLHVEGMSPYLTLDICIERHSRYGEEGCCFTEGDIAELPKILFDRDGLLRLVPPVPPDPEALRAEWARQESRFGERGRVTKYMARRLYLEAVDHYEEYVLMPLVSEARLLHTPDHADYGWTHISAHLPEDLVRRFEDLRRHRTLTDLQQCLAKADRLHEELNTALAAVLGENHV